MSTARMNFLKRNLKIRCLVRSTVTVSREINRYCETMLKDPQKRFKYLDIPQEFWMPQKNRLPLLTSFFRAYHCVQASSSESERLFSKAGLLMPSKGAYL